ncbi:5-formyltetrahydrofolate cyclo-ligase-like [Ambystoma mexicanum]|uniref:5-formyltetrahydrofolate cyclo-ligase-like n=1 Tax=Ambystoma mexicanum TaxID=8296 RepID=UPI0037E8FD8F
MMASVQVLKRALRADLKRRLSKLDRVEMERQSQRLIQKLFSHDKYRTSGRVAVYLSMPDEVQTEEIFRDIFRRGKMCFIPRYHPQSNHMDMVKLASAEEIARLPLTSWNIAQPADDEIREEALSTDGLDLILMPGLGFDKRGGRLGRGKGYYDAYLQRCLSHPKGKPYTIALAFKEQICDSVPVSDHDIAVDEILYETEDSPDGAM